MPGAVAMDMEVTIHLDGRQGAAVQAEPMTLLARREAVVEDAGQVLGRNTFPSILDAEA